MAILMQVTLELAGPDGPVEDAPEPVSRAEADSGAMTLVTGALEGAVSAVNAVVGAQGYELRRVRLGE